MTEVFNTVNQPVTGVYFGIFALIPLILSYFYKDFRGWFAVAMVFTCLLMSAIPLWDQFRVRDIIAKGKDLQVTRGTITFQWHTENWRYERNRIGVVTTVSEGFDLGDERFSWKVSGSYSPATFTNQDEPPISFTRGMPVEVTWFVDNASDNERRIVKLKIGRDAALTHNAASKAEATDPSSFGLFFDQFMQAVSKKDKVLTQKLMKFPFILGGHKVNATQIDYLWTGLFTPYTEQCLAKTASKLNADGSRGIICGENVFKFIRNDDAGSWYLTEVNKIGNIRLNHR